MEIKELNWEKFKDAALDEIYQMVKLQFAFLSAPRDGNRQCHPFVLCRDFLHDAIKAQITNKAISIYSFKFDSKENPKIDTKATRMLARYPTYDDVKIIEDMDKNMLFAKSLLNYYEDIAGVKGRTKVSRLEDADGNNKEKIWYFVGPPFWMKAPYLISMYTFLIRLSVKSKYFTGEKVNQENIRKFYAALLENAKLLDNDITYLKTCSKKMSKFVMNYDNILPKNWKRNYTETKIVGETMKFHNLGGIVSLCSFRAVKPEINDKFLEIVQDL